jgi:hypothetical protein
VKLAQMLSSRLDHVTDSVSQKTLARSPKR